MRNVIALSVSLAVGCVTQGTFDALKAEHEAAQAELARRNQTIREQEERIAALERASADLKQAIEAEQQKVKDLDERIAQMLAEKSTLLKDKSKLQSSVQEMTTALAELQKRKEEAESRIAEYRALLVKFKSLIDAGKLKVRIIDGRMVVVLASDVLFASGSATLSKDGKAAIAEVAQLLASIPNRKFQIEGHTDNVPISTAQYPSNWELAAARAITVLKTMIDAGMPTDRISAASFGESKPAAPNDTPEGRAQNRRIEIIIVPDLSTLPGFEELQRVERGA